MNTCFISAEEINDYKDKHKCGVYAALEALCPFYVVKFARRCGGYHAYESWTDYEIARKQK